MSIEVEIEKVNCKEKVGILDNPKTNFDSSRIRIQIGSCHKLQKIISYYQMCKSFDGSNCDNL